MCLRARLVGVARCVTCYKAIIESDCLHVDAVAIGIGWKQREWNPEETLWKKARSCVGKGGNLADEKVTGRSAYLQRRDT
jgi:hypothetical protein